MEAAATTRCALYLRISLDATGEQLAVARQREDCRKIAIERGWQIVTEYVDNSIGAYSKTRARPEYNRMVKDYQAGEFDALVCWDLDRLTRQPRQLEDWIDAAEDRGLLLVTANGEADLSTDGGRLFARIKASVARAESERKAARQKRALRQRAESGRPPLGVRLTGYTTAGEVIDDEAEIIQAIYRWFYEGESLHAIAAWLGEEAPPPRHGGKWGPSSVRTTLTNPRYAGRAVYQGKPTGEPGNWKPLVEEWMFDVVQHKLSEPKRRKQIGTDRKHLGSGLYLCGICERPVRAHTSVPAGGGTSTTRYRCPEGGHITRSAKPVDALILKLMRLQLARPELRLLLAEADGDQARALAAEIEGLRGRRRQAEADYDADLIDGTRYKAKTQKLDAELDAAEARRTVLVSSSAVAGMLTARDPVAVFDAALLGAKRTAIDFFMTVRLDPAPRGHHFDPVSVRVEWKHG